MRRRAKRRIRAKEGEEREKKGFLSKE